MARILALRGFEILDSRGNPTVEAEVVLDDGTSARASVPSGASTGDHEAWELRDGDEKRFHGKGVQKAIQNIETEIAQTLSGMEVTDQRAIDTAMITLDGTPNKSRLGANAILAVSLACARAAAVSQGVPLYRYLQTLIHYTVPQELSIPVPMFNVINGGDHADSGLSVQEFKIVPRGIEGYPEQLRAGSEIFQTLKSALKARCFTTDVGDEGGFAPQLTSHEEAFEILVAAIKESGYTPGTEVVIDIDAATDSFYNREDKVYELKPENVRFTEEQMRTLYKDWMNKFPLVSLEDPLNQEDWDGWARLKNEVPEGTLVIGDDLLVTNQERLKIAMEHGSCNAVLVKVNQIGSLSETIDTMELAKNNNYTLVISHRSGETTDAFIADLAVAASAEYIKTGSLSRGERLIKYNRLLEINREL